MTRQEAIEYGIRWKNAIIDRGDTEGSDAIQFLNMAIKALEQEPSCRNSRQVDLISRQDAIDALYDKGLSMTAWGEVLTMKWSDIQKCIEQIPSAKPKRGRWLPENADVPTYCSVCGHSWDEYIHGSEVWYTGDLPHFCPNCNADMRGDGE